MTPETIPTRADIEQLQAAMVKLPQAEVVTRHYFADGMYCRELWRPAGCTIVGKVHKKEHFYIVATGEVTIVGDVPGGRMQVKAPHVFVCQPGTKRAVYAHEDSTCITVHRTEFTELVDIEADLVEPDETALFGPGNVPISLEDRS